MTDIQALADRVEIAALGGEITDAVTMRDYDRFAALFTEDGAWRMPHIDMEFVGRDRIRAAVERLQGLWEYFVYTPHANAIRIDGDSATGREYVSEFGRLCDGTSHLVHAVYHDRYRRTPDGWRYTERLFEVRYYDETPLAGSPPSCKTLEVA